MHRLMGGCLIFLIAGWAGAQTGPVADLRTRKTGQDWPAFLGPDGTGISREKGIISPWPKQGLKVVWQTRLGTGYSMPSISLGRLFLFDRLGPDARLSCLESETGKPLWQFKYPTDFEDNYGYDNGPRCCPIVDGDRVYIHGPEGMIHCLSVREGKLLWKIDTRAEFGVVPNFFGVGSTPVIEGDLLIVQVGGSPPGNGDLPSAAQKSNGTGVVAFDKLTGKTRYRIADELASYTSPVLATIGGRRWCFVFARGGLVGFEPAAGKIDFHFPWRARTLESVNGANPVVVGDQVLISETYGPGSAMLKVKPGGYQVVWTDAEKSRKSLQAHWSTPIYHEGHLYGCSGRHPNNAELRCVDWATGKVLWSEPNLTRSSLLMVDGHFVCLAEDGTLLLLKVNAKKYEEVSRIEAGVRPGSPDRQRELRLDYPCWAAPILCHGLLYVRGKDRLFCLELIPSQ